MGSRVTVGYRGSLGAWALGALHGKDVLSGKLFTVAGGWCLEGQLGPKMPKHPEIQKIRGTINKPALWALGLETSVGWISVPVLGATSTTGHGSLDPGFLGATEEMQTPRSEKLQEEAVVRGTDQRGQTLAGGGRGEKGEGEK